MTNQWIALGFRLAAATNMVGVLSNVLKQKSTVMGKLLLQQHMATAFVASDYVWFFIAVRIGHGELSANPRSVVDQVRHKLRAIFLALQLKPPDHCRCIGFRVASRAVCPKPLACHNVK